MDYLLKYDVVNLNEIKTDLQVFLPGYESYMNYDKRNPHRGGTCVLIMQHLCKNVTELHITIKDQVWLKLSCVPCIIYGFGYVPPSVSPYFDYALLCSIQKKI